MTPAKPSLRLPLPPPPLASPYGGGAQCAHWAEGVKRRGLELSRAPAPAAQTGDSA